MCKHLMITRTPHQPLSYKINSEGGEDFQAMTLRPELNSVGHIYKRVLIMSGCTLVSLVKGGRS